MKEMKPKFPRGGGGVVAIKRTELLIVRSFGTSKVFQPQKGAFTVPFRILSENK